MAETLPAERKNCALMRSAPVQASADSLWAFPGPVRDAIHVLFRHKEKIVVFFLAVVMSTAAVLAMSRRSYTSEATLMVRRGRESVAVDPTVATGGPLYSVQTEWESELNSELQILKSRELLEKLVDAVGVDNVLGLGRKETARRSDLDDSKRRVLAVLKLQKRLRIELYRKSSIIAIAYTAQTPEMAQDIVTKLIGLFLDKHLAVHQAVGTYAFFVDQTEQLRRKLEQAENTLRDFKKTSGIASLGEQRNMAIARVAMLRDRLGEAEAERVAAAAKIKLMRTLVQPPDAAQPAGRLTTEDYRGLQKTLLLEETAMTGFVAKAEQLKAHMRGAEDELQRLNESEMRLNSLQRENDMLSTTYRNYCESLEQARINKALEQEKISNISIVQPAPTPLRPDPSRRLLKLLMALLVGAFGGVALAFVCDGLDRTLKSPEEAQERLGVPVLVTIPMLDAGSLTQSGGLARSADGVRSNGMGSRTALGEYLDILADRVIRALPETAAFPTVLGVTSCCSGEGVTTVAANLAVMLARCPGSQRVLYVDANMGTSAEHRVFGMTQAGAAEIATDAEGRISVLERNLYLPDRREREAENPTLPSALYASWMPRLRGQDYRFVIFDMPPIVDGKAGILLAGSTDGVILVVEAERVRAEVLQRARVLLDEAKSNILGVVFNKRRSYVPDWIYRRL